MKLKPPPNQIQNKNKNSLALDIRLGNDHKILLYGRGRFNKRQNLKQL